LNDIFSNKSKSKDSLNSHSFAKASSMKGLNKFKKNPEKGTAPKGQFEKYLVESNNIFY
jgi:hypothetical protein